MKSLMSPETQEEAFEDMAEELEDALSFIGQFLALPVADHGHGDLSARARAFLDRQQREG